MKKVKIWLVILFIAVSTVWLSFSVIAAENSFFIDAKLQPGSSGETQLVVQVALPPGSWLYADQFQVEVPQPLKIIPLSLPVPQSEKDAFSGGQKLVYNRSFRAVYLIENLPSEARLLGRTGLTNAVIKVHYQGCDQKTCFLPVTEELQLKVERRPEILKDSRNDIGLAENIRPAWLKNISDHYQIAAIQSGYMDARGFLAFLDLSGQRAAGVGAIQKMWRVGRSWLSVLLMVLGGLALNLTPCVLPLIPVNLAIIGAGVRAASVQRGFILGIVYGLGIVLAYGALGLATVLTGAQFGALNASPWFNVAVALVFLALGMALLDVFLIDFSRFQSHFRLKGQGMFFILILGAVSALLAGACVAPVVIAVLLLAADLYGQGQAIGLFMPFFLGLGMALPWPLAGAGLSFLPKPGKWMLRVKHVFAVIILLAGVYYFYLGSKLLYAKYNPLAGPSRGPAAHDNWLALPDVAAAEKENKTRGKPILVYFWASWCKNCQAMNAATFKNPLVRKKMDDFICAKYQAENPGDEPTKSVLRAFGVMGLPTFVILQPRR